MYSSEKLKHHCISPQCQYFVVRKKRLCRMSVKPGNHYCGEHQPQPKTRDRQDDTRIPCPNDSKHTCFESKLEKHLSICNARQQEQPEYILHNVNAPLVLQVNDRLPLAKIPSKRIAEVINKVNELYDTYLKSKITTLPEQPIHSAILPDFTEPGRTESSLRHLRQASSLIHVVEKENLVANNTAYIELGAGKGHLSYYAWHAWCQSTDSKVLLVDRASLRHKRDNKIKPTKFINPETNQNDTNKRGEIENNLTKSINNNELSQLLNLDNEDKMDNSDSNIHRIRADLAHLLLERVPSIQNCTHVVGFAKHLCGAATDMALRSITGAGVREKVRGVVLASCCHHRCEGSVYPANEHLQKLGVDADDFNTLLGIVSWATCGDGRSRDLRKQDDTNLQHTKRPNTNKMKTDSEYMESLEDNSHNINNDDEKLNNSNNFNPVNSTNILSKSSTESIVPELGAKSLNLNQEHREIIGRRAKYLLDWGRVLYLKDNGFDAWLMYYVPSSVSLENVCIVARKL